MFRQAAITYDIVTHPRTRRGVPAQAALRSAWITAHLASAVIVAPPLVVNAQPAENAAHAAVFSADLLGKRVRLWAREAPDLSAPITGELTALRADSVGIIPSGRTRALLVPRSDVTRIETSAGPATGSRAAAAGKGAIIGLLGGGILGVIAGNLTKHNAAKLGAAAGLAGAGVGAAAGAMWIGERWEPRGLDSGTVTAHNP